MTLASTDRASVVIVGGGVAALEAALALREIAPDRADITLLTDAEDFVMRPASVLTPFAGGQPQHIALTGIAKEIGATRVEAGLVSVEPDRHIVHTSEGKTLGYDLLLVCAGAHVSAPFAHGTVFDDQRADELLHGLVQDVEEGYTTRVAFVIPTRMAWPLPMYELALQTAERAFDTGAEVRVTIVSPEESPLAIFGSAASRGVAELLEHSGVEAVMRVHAQVPSADRIVVWPGEHEIHADRIVVLPLLDGPALGGLPCDGHGFLRTAPDGSVRGVPDVFAAGDCTDFAVKHGGIAAQQADAAAASIARRLGVTVEERPFRPVIQGKLITGREPRYLSATITGGAGFDSVYSETCPWDPATKIIASRLGRFLAAHQPARTATAG